MRLRPRYFVGRGILRCGRDSAARQPGDGSYHRGDHVVRHGPGGLCYGGGQLGLGLAGFVLAMLVLSVRKGIEGSLSRQQRASLTLMMAEDGLGESELRFALEADGRKISFLVGYLYEFTASPRGKVRVMVAPGPVVWQGDARFCRAVGAAPRRRRTGMKELTSLR